jgi:hypothetical protein
MLRVFLVLLSLFSLPKAGFTQQDHFLVDAGNLLAHARSAADAAEVAMLVRAAAEDEQAASTIITFGDTEWISVNRVPVQVSISGDWGSHDVSCELQLRFRRDRIGENLWDVQLGVMGAGLDAAYRQSGPAAVQITRYLPVVMGDEPAPFVTGDGFVNAQCGAGPLTEPEWTMPAIIARLQRQNAACVTAIEAMGFEVANPARSLPVECILYVAMLEDYAPSMGMSAESMARLRDCTPELAASFGDDRRLGAGCAGFLQGMAQNADATVGTCLATAGASGSLMVLDPNPHNFSAIYSGHYRRGDCKSYSVSLRFNARDSFAFTAALPATSSCLLVEPDQPSLHLFFTQAVAEKDLANLLRLRERAEDGTITIIATSYDQPEPGHIRLRPGQPLVAGRLYWVDIRHGPEGLHSITNTALAEPPAAALILPGPADEAGYATMMRFHVSPISRNPGLTRITDDFSAGIYQVVRDERLLLQRPTAFRLWFDWQGPATGAAFAQDALCMSVSVAQTGQPDDLLYPQRQVILRPASHYSATDRRLGRDTVNFFDWRPAAPIGSVTATIKPQEYWQGLDAANDPPAVTVDHALRFLDQPPARLELIVGFLEFDDYAKAGWQGDLAIWRAQFEAVRRYVWQTMPVGGVGLRFVGGFTEKDLGVTFAEADEQAFRQDAVRDFLAGCDDTRSNPDRDPEEPQCRTSEFYQEMTMPQAASAFSARHCLNPHQICFLIGPPTISRIRAATTPGRRTIEVSPALIDVQAEAIGTGRQIATDGQALTHEIGHSFGLNHLPYRAKDNNDFTAYHATGGIFPDIDGILMALSGRSGAMKSSVTGNADNPHYLAPVMFPQLLGESVAFMPTPQYAQLMNSIYGIGGMVFDVEQVFTHDWERQRFDEIKHQLRYPQDVTFPGEDGPSRLPRLALDSPARQGSVQDGLALALVLLDGPQGAVPVGLRLVGRDQAQASDLTIGATIGALRLSFEDGELLDLPISAPSFAGAAARQGDRGVIVDLSVFLPLTPARLADLRGIALVDLAGQSIGTLPIPALPDRIGADLMVDPDGILRLTWDAPLPMAPMLAFHGQGQAVPLGLGTLTGAEVDWVAAGLAGKGDLVVTLQTPAGQIAESLAIDLPAVLRQRAATMTEDGSLAVQFTQALAGDLPAFHLMRAEGALPLDATIWDDHLILSAPDDQTLCGAYPVTMAGDLRDIFGARFAGRVDWIFEISADTCGQGQGNQTQLVLTGAGAEQVFTGQVLAIAGGYDLQLNGLQVTIMAPETEQAGLLAVRPGENRRALILEYGQADDRAGQISLQRSAEGVSASFSAVWEDRQVAGSFYLPAEAP